MPERRPSRGARSLEPKGPEPHAKAGCCRQPRRRSRPHRSSSHLPPDGRHRRGAGEAAAARRTAGEIGVTCIAPLSRMTAPEAGWHHDGRFSLLDLVSLTEIKQSAEAAAEGLRLMSTDPARPGFVAIERVRYRYEASGPAVVDDVDWTIPCGEIHCLLGRPLRQAASTAG